MLREEKIKSRERSRTEHHTYSLFNGIYGNRLQDLPGCQKREHDFDSNELDREYMNIEDTSYYHLGEMDDSDKPGRSKFSADYI